MECKGKIELPRVLERANVMGILGISEKALVDQLIEDGTQAWKRERTEVEYGV